MSLRRLFVVSLPDSSLLYQKIFPTVEKRWSKTHPSSSEQILPEGAELLQLLLNELGVLQPTVFQPSRDSCRKNLQAPLFWIPYSSNSQQLWPVVIVECRSRLLCGIPLLEEQHSQLGSDKKMPATSSADMVIVLELLTKLTSIVELPTNKMTTELNSAIQKLLPFGRFSGIEQSENIKPTSSHHKTSWFRSKPKVQAHIKEEVRMIASRLSTKADVYGTIQVSFESDEDYDDIKIQISFPRLPKMPKMLFHSSAIIQHGNNVCNIRIPQLQERKFNLCHYSLPMEEAPVQALYKVRSGDETKVSIFLQLHFSALLIKATLNRMEVRIPVPAGSRALRILNAAQLALGTVSLLKEGTQIFWNLCPTSSTQSSAGKMKEEMILNVDIEMDSPSVCFLNTQALIVYSLLGSTISGCQVSLSQPSEFKLTQSSETKSSTYRVWNYEATDLI